jgi:hypothetical protein
MVLKTLSVADQLVETREFSRFSKNRNVCCLVTLRRNINFGFWMVDGGLAVLLRALRLRRDESSFALCGYGGTREGKFWVLDFGLWILDGGFWILDSEFSISYSGFALRVAVGFICRHGGNRPNWW